VTQFRLLIEGYNNRQNQAIALAIEDDVIEEFDELYSFSKEGTAASGWILMDYGSVICHIMTPQVYQIKPIFYVLYVLNPYMLYQCMYYMY
jgi:ribosomal silencing factor RsfS